MNKYGAIVKNVLDANTVEATIDLGFGCTIRRIFKVFNSSFPNFTDDPKEDAIAYKSKAQSILLGKRVQIASHKLGRNGRYALDISINGENYIDKVQRMQ